MALSPENLPPGWGYDKPRETTMQLRPIVTRSPRPRRAPSVAGGFVKGKSARIAYWLGLIRYEPDWKEIMTRWKVSRATAYRWAAFAHEAALHNDNEPRD